MKRLGAVALASCLLGCPASPTLPGDEAMGTFEFHATPLSANCALGALPDGGFDFEVTARNDKDGSGAWLVIGGIVGDAGFDGQYFTSVRSAPRTFNQPDGGSCALLLSDGGTGGCDSSLDETLQFALLSSAQNNALGDTCPADPLDGGVPFDPDAGINRPGAVGASYDAVRACGVLTDVANISGDCSAACLVPCALSYTLTGVRK